MKWLSVFVVLSFACWCNADTLYEVKYNESGTLLGSTATNAVARFVIIIKENHIFS
jgi:hypothetical protein